MQRGQSTWRLLRDLFLTFLKIGPVSFGGGYAMIPLIEKEVVERRQWLKADEITDILAVSESIPGAIAINTSTFIGYRLAGIRGAIAAMAGVLLPTFLIVVMLSIFFLKVQDHPKISAAFIAIRATIVALIAYAAIVIGRTALIDKSTIAIMLVALVILFIFNVHPIILIVTGALLGIIVIAVKKKLSIPIKLEAEKKQQKKPESKYQYDDYYIGHGI